MDDATKKRIDDIVSSKRVVLFMKGSPDFPECGFSMRAVQILRAMETEFGSFDVLRDPEVRQGIKEYANWPTIPQLYIDGKLIGGSDIMMEMWEQGELEKLVETAAS
ncbi:MAG: Grx4 family monothiol glutaredoxin [Myxococcota bacterium]